MLRCHFLSDFSLLFESLPYSEKGWQLYNALSKCWGQKEENNLFPLKHEQKNLFALFHQIEFEADLFSEIGGDWGEKYNK